MLFFFMKLEVLIFIESLSSYLDRQLILRYHLLKDQSSILLYRRLLYFLFYILKLQESTYNIKLSILQKFSVNEYEL